MRNKTEEIFYEVRKNNDPLTDLLAHNRRKWIPYAKKGHLNEIIDSFCKSISAIPIKKCKLSKCQNINHIEEGIHRTIICSFRNQKMIFFPSSL